MSKFNDTENAYPITNMTVESEYCTHGPVRSSVCIDVVGRGPVLGDLKNMRVMQDGVGCFLVTSRMKPRLPKATKVILNDPATVMFFGDDKVVTKCSDDDEYDMQLGMLLCALRKAGRNRARVDDWEPILSGISSAVFGPNGLRLLADTLNVTADAIENAETYVQGEDEKGKDA